MAAFFVEAVKSNHMRGSSAARNSREAITAPPFVRLHLGVTFLSEPSVQWTKSTGGTKKLAWGSEHTVLRVTAEAGQV